MRRQRVTKTYSKKEARAHAASESRARRMKALNAREAAPEKALMRDYVDARFNIGEYLLPSVVVILAVTVLGSYWPTVGQVAHAGDVPVHPRGDRRRLLDVARLQGACSLRGCPAPRHAAC